MSINGAQLHLLLNHLPVVGFVGVVLSLLVAMKIKSRDVSQFVLLGTAVVGLSALGSFWTGEPAEEVVEHLPGVSESLIHEHEEAAELATVLAVITAITAAGAFVLQRRKVESLAASLPVTLLLALVTAGAMGKAAHDGGKIRHPEIRDGDQAPGAARDEPQDDD